MRSSPRYYFFSLFFLLIILVSLPLLVLQVKKIQKYLSRAEYKPLDLVIEGTKIQGFYEGNFNNLAQGGEVGENGRVVSIEDTKKQLELLKPKLIRIDHIFDLYTKVERTDNRVVIDFTELDKILETIGQIGAIPFLSLSYMPTSISKNGEITGPPTDWNLWSDLIRQTVEHVSGIENKNFQGVYYEIWNEPDLFGNWRMWGERDYKILYKYGVAGATSAANVNNFYIGGPSITHPMSNWITGFGDYLEKEKLRLDFLSFHRYSFSADDFLQDLAQIKNWSSNYPILLQAQKIISEFGPSSDNHAIYDNNLGAIFTLSTAAQLAGQVDKVFQFEIKDGPSPKAIQYWGRWGIFTNEKFGLTAKPRFEALKILSELSGNILATSGQGSNTSGLAIQAEKKFQLLLVNYQPFGEIVQTELAKFKINNIPNGEYNLSVKNFGNGVNSIETVYITTNSYSKILTMTPNSAVVYTLEKIRETANFKLGRFSGSDYALVFDNLNPVLSFPQVSLSPSSGTLEFWANFKFPFSSFQEEKFLTINLKGGQRLLGVKRQSPKGFSNELIFGVYERESPLDIITSTNVNWKAEEWHHLAFTWERAGQNNLTLKIFFDGKKMTEKIIEKAFAWDTSPIAIGGFNGAIDELRFSNVARNPGLYYPNAVHTDNLTVLLRNFNGALDN